MLSAARDCPLCDTSFRGAALFAEENIDRSKLSAFSFASRKEPEFMNHRLVRCTQCDLVYVERPPSVDELAHAYHVAEYDSSDEASDAALAYIRALEPMLRRLPRRESALEIGTGTGAFLDHLARVGFVHLTGVEPSSAAIATAPPHRRGWLHEAIFDERDFAPESFDLVCCFMTMEHVRDPRQIAQAAMRLLRPGGAFVTVTHDYRSLVNRLLGKRSPIIDIEHMQLFSPRSIEYLFEQAGFADITVVPFVNRYALRYWLRLTPIPHLLKEGMLASMAALRMDRIKIGINVGNLIAAGFKASPRSAPVDRRSATGIPA
jgi:SAM-dependent methyltransferase